MLMRYFEILSAIPVYEMIVVNRCCGWFWLLSAELADASASCSHERSAIYSRRRPRATAISVVALSKPRVVKRQDFLK
jgi:hypothetical protein